MNFLSLFVQPIRVVRHLQKRIGKKGIKKTVGMGPRGESPMPKSVIDFSILKEISHKIVCILHTWVRSFGWPYVG